ncbi:hypothetical protein FCV25MIE_33341 [Fagus crenata]
MENGIKFVQPTPSPDGFIGLRCAAKPRYDPGHPFVSRIVKVRGGIIAGPVRAGFVYSNTALRKEETPNSTRRGKECLQAIPKFLIASPSFHGGRGALPSAGGHPADLTFLAGGGC